MEDINAFVFHTVLALSAPTGHLPLEGKAAIQKYRFPHPTSAPFGAPPSIGRREYPRKPLPLEGKADDTRETCHSQTFGHRPINICGEVATTTLNPLDL